MLRIILLGRQELFFSRYFKRLEMMKEAERRPLPIEDIFNTLEAAKCLFTKCRETGNYLVSTSEPNSVSARQLQGEAASV